MTTIILKRYPDDWDDLNRLDRVEFYPEDRDNPVNFKNALRRLRWSKAIPEIITIIPVIKNKFDLDAAEVKKK